MEISRAVSTAVDPECAGVRNSGMSNPLPHGTFLVGGATYAWQIRYYAGATTPFMDARGMSVEVTLEGVNRKELIIDFAFKDYGFGKPRSINMVADRLKKCVPLALAKGWEPETKGKPFRVDAEFLEERPSMRK